MQLSQQDSLRINVLLNQPLQAIRIDDGKMIVYGLTEKGEAKIQLHPDCKDEVYVKRVKEALSSHVLGSPGGYPVFLKRWTRMGQARSESLESLLKLGEPEAVVAVVGANGITDEIARRAWWIMPNSDNARRMLANESVVNGEMGKVLADFLIEFLPFEEEPKNIIESVRLVLQPGLIEQNVVDDLWKIGQRKNAFLVGFLKSELKPIPLVTQQHASLDEYVTELQQLAEQGNRLAEFLISLLSEDGQAYLKTVEQVLKKPANQDVVVALFEAVEEYFSAIRPHSETRREIEEIMADAKNYCETPECCSFKEEIQRLQTQCPTISPLIESIFILSCIGEQLVAPVFARTDAVGSVMRKKLAPITTPVTEHIRLSLGQ